MSHFAEVQLADPAIELARPPPQPFDLDENGERSSAARGIITAILLSTPFWALVAFALYLLL